MAFIPLEQLSRLHDGYQQRFMIDGHNLLLCHAEGQSYLIENRCPHMDIPLSDASQIPGPALRCIAHGIEFDLINGKARGPLADTIDCLNKFPLAYEGTQIGVDSDCL